MSKLNYIVTSFLLLILFSCAQTKNFHQSKSFLKNDNELLKKIDSYLKENYFEDDSKRIACIYLSSKINQNNKDYYIGSISNISSIYYYPYSFYFSHKGRPILVYSKMDGFLNPDDYDEQLINTLKEYLYDDMLVDYIHKTNNSYEYKDAAFILHHPKIWVVSNEGININKDFSSIKNLLFDNWDLDLIKYYRVKKGGRDDRINN